MAAFLGVFVFVALPPTLYWQRDGITALFVGSAVAHVEAVDNSEPKWTGGLEMRSAGYRRLRPPFGVAPAEPAA
jgi:hypothetical protein